MESTSVSGEPIGLDRKRMILLLRTVVIFTAAYFVLAGREDVEIEQLLYVAAFLLSNLALGAAPRRLFQMPQFGPMLLLADTALILFGLSLRHGLSQDLMLVYSFTIFLATVGETIGSIAVGSALISAVYAYWLWASGNSILQTEAWLRVPFFFLIAVFYASLTEQLKRERRKREHAEQESRHLRLLLDLAGVFSETHATREFVNGLGRFIEQACPGLECRVALAANGDAGSDSGVKTFTMRAHGRCYGDLQVRSTLGSELTEREQWLCQMVVHAAAGALYASEQSEQARSAAEMKESFLATVSHELRTPLHAILGYAEILEGVAADGNGNSLLRESVERMRANACRLQDLVEEVLGFAEIRAGQRAVRAERLHLKSLLSELTSSVRELVGAKPVNFVWRVAPDADVITSDRRKLRQVLVCLLSNAAKFTEAGQITLVTRRVDARTVEIEVADTGIGISKKDLDVVFDEFRQVDGSITRRYGGLGLGLALARELATLLGGAMDIDSRVGTGTTVTIRLPLTYSDHRQDDAGLAAEEIFSLPSSKLPIAC